VLEVHLTNRDMDGIAHNIDFHAVLGPGGGAPLLFAEKEQTKVARFRLLYPGQFYGVQKKNLNLTLEQNFGSIFDIVQSASIIIIWENELTIIFTINGDYYKLL
jgi:hypothetical protein